MTYVTAVVWLLWMGVAAGDPSSFSPARFADGDDSLARQIEYPDVEEDGVTVLYCDMLVAESGFVENNGCLFNEEAPRSFRKAVYLVARSARIIPASVDNEPQRVLLHYRVVFLKQNEEKLIGVYPNWGHDIDKYGIDYHAPQRYTDWVGLGEDCIEYANWGKMTIGKDGGLKGEVAFQLDDHRVHELCTRRIRNLLKRAKYIPAHFEGKPVEATYSETWGEYRYLHLE